ncbi:MAG: pseudouridine synthase [Rhodocyclales bacterium]|nr:pseudouridine synthase [Rhodocyclales bacterium]
MTTARPLSRRTLQQRAAPLSTRNGVSPTCIVLPPGPWSRIADFIAERLPAVSPAEWAKRMLAGDVLDESGIAVTAERHYEVGLRIFYYRALEHEPPIPFEETVLFQDEYLVVADKPHFLPVIPSGRYVQETLLVRLKRKLGIDSLAPIHRIDRETAGLVLFSIQPSTRGRYQDLFRQRSVRKHYEAIAPWRPELKLPLVYRSRIEEDAMRFMQMREVDGEPNAETHIDVLEVRGDLARYALSPVTGRKHQLRAHCTALGIPILNDLIYPVLCAENSDDHTRPLQLLAKSIAFTDPISGELRNFQSARTLNFAEPL